MLSNRDWKFRAAWVGWFLLLHVPMALPAADPSTVVYSGATILMVEGDSPIVDGRVIVRGERIECVSGPDGCPSAGATEVSFRGMWLGPGLVDAHVHLELERAPIRTMDQQAMRFALGITTVRDAGTVALDRLLEERTRAESATLPVPRVVVTARTSPFVERFGTSNPTTLVGRLADLGVDGIKLKDPTDARSMAETIRAAKAAGLTVSGHTWNGPPPRVLLEEAVAAGVDGIVHLGSFAPLVLEPEINESFPNPDLNLGAFFAWRKGLWSLVSLEELDPVLNEMVVKGVWLEPSLAFEFWFGRRPPLPPDLEFLRGGPMSWRELVKSLLDRGPRDAARFEGPYRQMESLVLRFHDMGGEVVAGSDGVLPGFDLYLEIDRLEAAGLSASAALRAATHNAAKAIGRGDELGTIAPGRFADMVVYSSDPLASSEGRRAIHRVIKGGHVHDPAALLGDAKRHWRERNRSVWISRAARVALALTLVALASFGLLRNRSRRLRE